MRQVTYISYKCVICSNTYKLPKSSFPKKTCSDMCLSAVRSRDITKRNHSVIKRGRVVECHVCGKSTYRYPSQLEKGYNHCSKKCWYSVMKPNAKQIQALHDNRSKRDYSDPKARLNHSIAAKKAFAEGRMKPRYGSDNNLWKGGIATLQNQLRQTAVYKEWRKKVYERDAFSCQHCGTNKDLHAHHIKSFSKYPELRYDIDNGITLCRPCHGKVHGRYLPDISKANKKVRSNGNNSN